MSRGRPRPLQEPRSGQSRLRTYVGLAKLQASHKYNVCNTCAASMTLSLGTNILTTRWKDIVDTTILCALTNISTLCHLTSSRRSQQLHHTTLQHCNTNCTNNVLSGALDTETQITCSCRVSAVPDAYSLPNVVCRVSSGAIAVTSTISTLTAIIGVVALTCQP